MTEPVRQGALSFIAVLILVAPARQVTPSAQKPAAVPTGAVNTARPPRGRADVKPMDPIGVVSPEQERAFHRGKTLFQKSFTPAEGLGPELNASSCASCHSTPTIGGRGPADRPSVDWVYADERDLLGAPAARFVVDATGAIVPAGSGARERRRIPTLFGVGLLEAVSINELLARHDPMDRDRDGISGRLPWRDGCHGRFGWQSTACDVQSFVESALANELGIQTRPGRRREISEGRLSDLMTFVRLLPPSSFNEESGRDVFERAHCSSCHVPVTGMARLSRTTVPARAYTDLLLHEMGEGPLVGETGSRTEVRTPSLWGRAGAGAPYWHDGSAATLPEAILRHHGEGEQSRRLYVALDRSDQQRLIRFVRTR
jgi:CxxC motif-containing protein (DUF1111 family)